MKFIVKAMLVHADGSSNIREQAVKAATHAHALDELAELIDTLGQIDTTDTLVVYAAPVSGANDEEAKHQTFLAELRDAMTTPLTREKCLEQAAKQKDPPGRDWWLHEAQRHRPAAQGGGLTEEAAERDSKRMEEWLKRQQQRSGPRP